MKRIQNLLPLLASKGIDGLLVTNVSNVRYLSGFTGEAAHLVVSAKGCYFFTDPRYTEQALKECHKEIQVMNWVENQRCGIPSYAFALEHLQIRALGFESSYLSHSAFAKLQEGLKPYDLMPTESLVETLRRVKDAEEISHLRTAAQISDRALELALPHIKAGISELELTAQLEYYLKTNGAEGLSFDSIILAGKKTSLLHGQPGKETIEKGDFILFDFGALYKSYHADISRTFILGEPSAKQREVYDLIQRAQWSAIETLKAGVSGTVPDQKVRETLSPQYIDYYYQGLGHGTGLDVHEAPNLSQSSLDTLEAGMVLTVEPGIYIPDWGGLRIEDSVLVTETGFESLNQFSRDLISL